jgi:hypothetical protein
MQSDLLLGDLGDQMYHFIDLTLWLFNTPTVADVIDYFEYISNLSENNKLLKALIKWRGNGI